MKQFLSFRSEQGIYQGLAIAYPSPAFAGAGRSIAGDQQEKCKRYAGARSEPVRRSAEALSEKKL